MLNFEFLEKGLGIVCPSYFVYGFSIKMFLILYYVDCPTFIVSLLLLLEILGNMCIVVICFPDCDVITFDTNLIFSIKPSFYMPKKSSQKFKHLENEESF